jgi:hypothetical protein
MMDKEQKKSIEDLMYHNIKHNYKDLCDTIKVKILDKLIEIAAKKPEGRECITLIELEYIKRGIEELRKKEKDVEIHAIVSVIENLISRGDNELDKVK